MIPTNRPKGKVILQMSPIARRLGDMPIKDRADHLAEAMGAAWSRRQGYTLSPARSALFLRLYNAGWRSKRHVVSVHKHVFTFLAPGSAIEYSLKEAESILNQEGQSHGKS